MSDLTRPDTRIEENLRLEIKRLNEEIARLTAHLGRLMWSVEDTSNELALVADLTLTEAKIITVLLDGRWLTYQYICEQVCRESSLPNTVKVHISKIKTKLPWLHIEMKHGVGCRLHVDSIKRIRQMMKVEL